MSISRIILRLYHRLSRRILDSLTVTLSEMDKADAPRDKSAPPIEELLDVALGQRTEEHQAELRRQVKHAVHTVAQQAAHLEVRAEEVARLESVIHEFKDASQREEIHLKSEIAALQGLAAELHGQVAELEVWRARALELEGSTLWRMMAPVRWVLHRIKLCLRAVLKVVRFIRRGLLFCRYHFAMGGWRGLSVAGRTAPKALTTPPGNGATDTRLAGIDRA